MRLWLDTSVTRAPGHLRMIATEAYRRGIPVLVHAHVHLETCRHYRCRFGANYSPDTVDVMLRDLHIDVADMNLDRPTAERWAQRLHALFPSDAAWQTAKLATIGGELREGFATLPGDMPMTTDWWVALQVEEAPPDRVAVEDRGHEWEALRLGGRALSAAEATAWLATLPVPGP
jgi:hypothetical protein